MLSLESLLEVISKAKNFKGSKDAFNCSKCPKDGCPLWWNFEWQMQDKNTHQIKEKVVSGCGAVLFPIFMADMVMASYRTGDIVQEQEKETRDTFKKGIVTIGKLALRQQQIELLKSGEEK